jgi:hypothetical protein
VQTPPATPTETKPPETTPTTPVVPEKITIEGIGEVPVEELKNGYFRQSDYTKKTQDLAHQRKEAEEAIKFYEHLRSNPQLAQQLAQQTQLPQTLDPVTSKVVDLEQKFYDLMLQQEINTLQTKYPDFEVREVLETARDKQLNSLEDAYLIVKSRKQASQPVDANQLKEQIRAELLKELEAERNATQTIIATNNAPPVQDNTPQISDAEKRVARMMKLSEAEYDKWRDANKK